MTKASQVLDGWHHDPEFIGADGQPRVLSFDANSAGKGFSDLVRRYAPALPADPFLHSVADA